MNRKAILVLAATLASAFSITALAGPKLDGAYKLVAIKTSGGDQTEADVRGMIVVHGRYIAFVRANVGRKTWSQDEPVEERTKKMAAAYQGLAATCGAFEVQGDTLTLTQLAQASPVSMGTTSKWQFKLQGGSLSLRPQGVTGVEFVFDRLP